MPFVSWRIKLSFKGQVSKKTVVKSAFASHGLRWRGRRVCCPHGLRNVLRLRHGHVSSRLRVGRMPVRTLLQHGRPGPPRAGKRRRKACPSRLSIRYFELQRVAPCRKQCPPKQLMPNPSLERTSTGLALGPRTGQCHHPLRGSSANAGGVRSAQTLGRTGGASECSSFSTS